MASDTVLPVPDLIFKICPAALWAQSVASGTFTGAPVDLADGYIHFSTADQARETAAKHFAGQSDLLLIAVEVARLGIALRWEPSRGGALFPHLYAPLACRTVAWVRPLPLGPDGTHQFGALDSAQTS
ncbi:MAG: dihydroorotate dehydrogenase [Rhizobiales bacterium 32-66-8]|nr:MAG: dihydroorotate dehydrogenase [Rhizobiales bacterium 32-66-8]